MPPIVHQIVLLTVASAAVGGAYLGLMTGLLWLIDHEPRKESK
jgi:hypothetical protein